MKKLLLKTWLLLTCLLFGVGTMWAADADYTLTPSAGSNNSYTGNCDVTVNGITWNVAGNALQIPWRLGGKSITDVDRTVYSKTAYTNAVSKVDLTVGAASSITVNSLKLVYSTNADFSNSSEISETFAANSTISFEADFPAKAYYKFVFNVTVSGSNNKFVEFSKVEIYNKSTNDGGSSSEPGISAESTLDIPYTEGDGTFEVTWTGMEDMDVNLFTDAECTSTFEESWFQVELNSDNNIYYVAEENTNNTARTVYMQLYGLDEEAEGYPHVVTVTQAAAPNKYAVNITAPENGTLAVTCGGEDIVSGNTYAVGQNINIVATPASGYKFRNIQVVDASTHTFTASNEKEWTMGDHDITIKANFDEIPTYTVSFSVNRDIVQSEEYEENAIINAPKVADILGKVFLGWIDTEISSTTDVAPSFENIENLTATADKTYYAVFATVEVNAETWNKVTDASSLEENDVIAIVSSEAVDYNIKGNTTKYNGYIAMGKTQNNNNRAGEVVTVADDVLTINDNVQQVTLTKATFDEKTDWQLGVDGGFLYANNSSSNYLKTQETNNINGLWNISITDGKATIYAKYSSFTRNYIRVNGNYANSTTNAPLVTAYKSDATTGVLASIYKKEGGNTYSDYCTTVPSSYTREVTSGNYGTICLPYASTEFTGASFYSLAGVVKTGEEISGIALEPVTELEAGKAYVFKASDSQISVTYSGTPVATPVNGANGMIGNFAQTTIDSKENNITEDSEYYFLGTDNLLHLFYGEATINMGENRAYFILKGVDEASDSNPARMISIEDFTSINSINNDHNISVIYNLQGNRVENPAKGIYVVNGKKVMMK